MLAYGWVQVWSVMSFFSTARIPKEYSPLKTYWTQDSLQPVPLINGQGQPGIMCCRRTGWFFVQHPTDPLASLVFTTIIYWNWHDITNMFKPPDERYKRNKSLYIWWHSSYTTVFVGPSTPPDSGLLSSQFTWLLAWANHSLIVFFSPFRCGICSTEEDLGTWWDSGAKGHNKVLLWMKVIF